MQGTKDLGSCVRFHFPFSVTSDSCELGRRSCRAPDSSVRWRRFLVVAVIACNATHVTGFLSVVPPSPPTSAAAASRYVGDIYVRGSSSDLQAPQLLPSSVSRLSSSIEHRTGSLRQRGITISSRRRQGRLQRLAASMSGAGSRLQPGRGTQVVLLRHGMSTFNKLNIFTGWCDVPLAEEGKNEASEAGKLLAAAGYRFDVAYASVLKRACTSLHRLLEGCGQPYIPIKTHWRLNERHYGALQGRNKAKLEEAMGDIVVEWRRGYATRPPRMTDAHPHWPLISMDGRYRGLNIPETESLEDTADRVMEYWESNIVPDIRAGKRVLVVSHANTLRSLIKKLDGVADDAIRHVKIPTGEPFVYNFDSNLQPIDEPNEHGFRGKFVGDMMGERDAAIDEFKRREQACMVKWEANPELVPEECYLNYDVDVGADAITGRAGDDQASLGLDRYTVGLDLPLPPSLAVAGDKSKSKSAEEELGAPVIADEETMEGIIPEEAVADGEGFKKILDRNETSSAPPVH